MVGADLQLGESGHKKLVTEVPRRKKADSKVP